MGTIASAGVFTLSALALSLLTLATRARTQASYTRTGTLTHTSREQTVIELRVSLGFLHLHGHIT